MKKLLALSSETARNKIAEEFDGVDLIRAEYICRIHMTYITTLR